MLNKVIGALKISCAPILFRHCPIGLGPRRLYCWLNCLLATAHLKGAVLEIGVAAGGTAAFSHKFLREGGDTRPYYCIDTFAGFEREQFAEDVRLGNSWLAFGWFSTNPQALVRKVLAMHGAKDAVLVKGNISTLSASDLPETVSACLLDVDLAVPTYDALKLIWPKLEPGGKIAVDDCYESSKTHWQALKGLRKFCTEAALAPEFHNGMAVLTR
jgi:hypothetical protein